MLFRCVGLSAAGQDGDFAPTDNMVVVTLQGVEPLVV